MAVTCMLENRVPIVKAEVVVKAVKRNDNLTVTAKQVKSIMKDEMGLGYRMSRKVPVQSNSERCLVMRQQYAMKMLELL